MSKKLRKTLGDVNAPSCVALRVVAVDNEPNPAMLKWNC